MSITPDDYDPLAGKLRKTKHNKPSQPGILYNSLNRAVPDLRRVREIASRDDVNNKTEFAKAYGITINMFNTWRLEIPQFCEIIEQELESFSTKTYGVIDSWEPDLMRIEQLASMGLTRPQIATQMQIPYSTWNDRRKRMPEIDEAIRAGHDRGVAVVKSVLYKMATSGNNLKATLEFLNRFDKDTERVPGEGGKSVIVVKYNDKEDTVPASVEEDQE